MIRRFHCIFYLAVLWSLVSCVYEPVNGPVPSDNFIKYYGVPGTNEVVDMILGNTGNVIILGTQEEALATATRDIVIMEIDSIGNLLTKKIFDIQAIYKADSTLGISLGRTDDEAVHIKATGTGYLLCATFTDKSGFNGSGTKIFWCLLDNQFDIIKKEIINGTDDSYIAGDIAVTREGDVLIVGATEKQASNDALIRPQIQQFLTKKSIELDTTYFIKTYGFNDSDDYFVGVYELENGNIGAIGYVEYTPSGPIEGVNVQFKVLNNLGSSSIQDLFFGASYLGDSNFDDIPTDFITSINGIVIVGTSSSTTGSNKSFPFLLGIRESGDLIFNQLLMTTLGDFSAEGNSVTYTEENDLVITGRYVSFADTLSGESYNDEGLFMRTNQMGQMVGELSDFERHFGLLDGNDVGKAILTLPDGSIAVGATIDFGSNRTIMSYIKFNDRGQLRRQ